MSAPAICVWLETVPAAAIRNGEPESRARSTIAHGWVCYGVPMIPITIEFDLIRGRCA